MKKDPSNYTAGEQKYLARQQAVKAGRPNAVTYFKNVAVTKAGDFVIGLTYNSKLQLYSASAIEIDGVRDNGKVCEWDREGGALYDDLSTLNIGSVHSGVRTI